MVSPLSALADIHDMLCYLTYVHNIDEKFLSNSLIKGGEFAYLVIMNLFCMSIIINACL